MRDSSLIKQTWKKKTLVTINCFAVLSFSVDCILHYFFYGFLREKLLILTDFSPPSLKLPQTYKICHTPLLHPAFFHVPWHSLKGSLEFNSIDRLSTQFDHLCLQTALQSSTLGTFYSTISSTPIC